MNKCKIIHETIIKDIIDAIDFFKDEELVDRALDSTKRSKYSSSSIAKLSSNLVLEFPVLCSRTLSINAMTMVAKAIERKCIVMLQLLFSAYQMTDADNAVELINKFHKNIKLADKVTVDDMVTAMDRLTEGTDIKVDRRKVELIKEDMQNIFFTIKESNEHSIPLSEYSVSRTLDGSGVNVFNERSPYKRNDRDTNYFKDQLLDSDIKKANEVVPSIMVVNLTHSDGDKVVPINNVAIGVKARMIPLDSNDIINHMITKVGDKNWLLQLIRATTREISFFKDFVFMIDRAKIDALSRSRRGSANPMWKVLERRAIGSRTKRIFGKDNDVMAITTLVISQEEVDYLRKEENIDMESFSNAGSVMEGYNLMGMCIVDESLEVAKFLFDTGDGNWENYSFRSLERESSDNEYKKIINLMTKVAR